MTFDGALFVHMQDDHDVFSRALEAEARSEAGTRAGSTETG